MRIALIAPPWLSIPPIAYGGIETVIDDLAKGFTAVGHEVLLCATGDSTCPVPTTWSFSESQSMRMGTSAAELRQVLFSYAASGDADIIHDHTLIGPVFAAERSLRNVVSTCHGAFDEDLQKIYQAAAPRVPTIAISQHHARSAGAIPIAKVIHHGVNPDRFPVGSGSGGYLAFLGRMAPAKGVVTAIRVARAAGLELRIAAKMREPEECQYFEESVRPLLGSDATFLGELGFADKVELLGNASALLNPIDWPEPFGMVMIEALACATPVVARRRGSVTEILQDGLTGFICDSEDDLVEAVRQTSSLDRGACRRSVERYFSAQRMVDDHLDFYQSLLDSERIVDLRKTPSDSAHRGRGPSRSEPEFQWA
jgi:glycosyltransferase involved in cell wall biosynthesis